LRRLDQVRRKIDRQSRYHRQMLGTLLCVASGRVKTGTNRRAAHVDLAQHALNHLEGADFTGQRLGKGGEFLAERHRHGVLELRSAHLDDVGELTAFRSEGVDQVVHRGDEASVAERDADVKRGRVGVVG
jgi:hypothetical protein